MRLLSLDASSTNIGWVLWHDDVVVMWGSVQLSRGKADLGRRLIAAADAIDGWLAEHQPDAVAAEGAAFDSSRIAAQSEVRGVLRLACRRVGLVLIDVAPSTAKKALAGHGHADKDAMADHARRYLRGLFDEHAADAVGVGLGAMAILRGEVVKRAPKKRKKAA